MELIQVIFIIRQRMFMPVKYAMSFLSNLLRVDRQFPISLLWLQEFVKVSSINF